MQHKLACQKQYAYIYDICKRHEVLGAKIGNNLVCCASASQQDSSHAAGHRRPCIVPFACKKMFTIVKTTPGKLNTAQMLALLCIRMKSELHNLVHIENDHGLPGCIRVLG